MIVYTDARSYARTLLPPATAPGGAGGAEDPPPSAVEDDPRAVGASVRAFFGEPVATWRTAARDPLWRHALVSGVATTSQYARVIELARAGVPLPDGMFCVAETGADFHGFRGRSWLASPGNLHLTVHLAPRRPVPRFESVFLALAAVSVLDAIDRLPGLEGRASIKWVNDVLLDEAKVAGVLAHTQSRGSTVTSVILGIGVNVAVTPPVQPTPFVPAATCLRAAGGDPSTTTEPAVLQAVLDALAEHYRGLLARGHGPLLERYRARSAVLHRDVVVSVDRRDERPSPIAAGRVTGIGDGLELWLAGRAEPVTTGRLIL